MSKESDFVRGTRRPVVGGLLLVLGGLLALVGQFVPGGWGFGLILLLGVAFIVAGIVTRQPGWFIPGGILTGIGAGTALVAGPLARFVPAGPLSGNTGALFMQAFAGGWFLITVLTAIFSHKTQWWPLIPGSIMALIGLASVFGSGFATVLDLLGRAWPLALIFVGLLLLFRPRRSTETEPMLKY